MKRTFEQTTMREKCLLSGAEWVRTKGEDMCCHGGKKKQRKERIISHV